MNTVNRTDRRAPRGDSRKGAVFVEFALGFIVFLTVTLGVFEGARMIWTYSTLSHAAREGARYAMVHGHQSPVADSVVADRVKNHAIGLPGTVTVATIWGDATKSGSSVVAVQVSYPMTMVAAPLLFGQNTMNMSYTARATVAE